MAKSPNPIDVHVGMRVRLRRVLLGMSQEKLGEALGVTFQQVQKYEKGANRIGASRLHQISEILDVPVAYFFEELPGEQAGIESRFAEAPSPDYFFEMVNSTDGLQLMRAFVQIGDPQVRRRVVDLVKAIAGSGEEPA